MKTNSILAIVLSLLAVLLAFADGEAKPILEDGIVKVENDGRAVAVYEIVRTFTHHHIPSARSYIVGGNVRYSDLEGVAFLRVWSHPLNGDRPTRRSLEEFGMTKEFRGTSDWQRFEVPFFRENLKSKSVLVTVEVMIHGKGSVEVENLTAHDAIRIDVWFDNRTAGFYGGLAGSAVGLYGALFGCLAGFLVPRGKGRGLLTSMTVFGFAVGVALLLMGLVALFSGQPYHVWYGFTLIGGILVIVLPGCFLSIRKQYEQFEQRRMQALDM